MDYRMVPPLSALPLHCASPWEPSNTQKETSPLAHYVRNSLPHKSHRFCSPMRKNWSQQLGTIFPPPLAHFIRNSLPRCAPQCSSGPILPFFGFQKLYTIYGAKPIYAPENLDSFASLTLYARFARYPNSLPT